MSDVGLDDLPDLLRAEAARVVPPPVTTVLGRARRRQRRRAATAGLGVLLLVLLATTVLPGSGGSLPERLAGPAREVELLAGSDDGGAWRLLWRPGDRCLVVVRTVGEGGSCGQADPPSLSEALVRVVGGDASPETLVAGLVPEGTATVAVTPTGGEPVVVDVVRAGGTTLFAARLPGVVGVDALEPRDAEGSVLATLPGPPLPPPLTPGQPVPPAPGARGQVPAVWVVAGISDDRRTVDVIAYPSAGGCTRPGATQALDTPDGMRLMVHVDVPLTPDPCPPPLEPLRYEIDLPRALAPGEGVLGECVPDSTFDGQQCLGLVRNRGLPIG